RTELRVVEDVVELGTKIQSTRFRFKDTWKFSEQAGIGIVQPRAAHYIAPGITEITSRRLHKCVLIEKVLPGAVTRPIAYQIGSIRISTNADAGVVAVHRDVQGSSGLEAADSRQLPVSEQCSRKTVLPRRGNIVDVAQNEN